MKIPEKWKRLGNKDTRYYIITGGRGSGKSYEVTLFATLLTFEEKETILFTRKTLTSAHISIIPEFAEKVETLNAESVFNINKTDIENLQTGSKILFRGLQASSKDNTANLKSLQGVTCWILDEAEELTDEKTFDRIDLSVRNKNKHNRVILILNPATKEHFVYQRFFEKAGVQPGFTGIKGNVTYIHTDYRDNIENLSQSFLDQVQYIKENNPAKYEHQILGGWLDKAEGVIYTNWKLGEFKEVSVPVWGLDFGFVADPTALVKVCVDSANKRIYIKEQVYQPKLTTSDIKTVLKRYVGNGLIIADSAEPRLIEELKRDEINIIGTQKGAGSVVEGITLIQDYELIIDPDSTNLIKELNNYAWSDKKSQTPVDLYNHCFVGETLITTNLGLKPIKDIKVGDLVLTRKGYKRVLKKFNNGKKQVNKYLMRFDTFSVYLCSTKEHKIKSEKWTEISKLKSGMTVYHNKSSVDLFLDYTQKKGIFQEGQSECTFSFGSITTGKDQKGIISTIKTEILGITVLKILKPLKGVSIYLNTLKKGLRKIKSGSRNFIQQVLKKLKNGTSLKKESYGILNMEREHGIIENTKSTSANNAEANLNHDTEELLSFAITTAKLKHFDIGESWNEEVYDIMVEDCHEYFANGILVHNCSDAFRYAISYVIKPKTEHFFF